MRRLLTPHGDLKEISLNDADFSWFTDGSYLKDDNGKYCVGMLLQFLLMLLRQYIYL